MLKHQKATQPEVKVDRAMERAVDEIAAALWFIAGRMTAIGSGRLAVAEAPRAAPKASDHPRAARTRSTNERKHVERASASGDHRAEQGQGD
ncbi:MAG: hypothetical protein HY678_12575 [Chloroflexi bacterium]|nr:hypothetical protein [Chloroflexota bacterium]